MDKCILKYEDCNKDCNMCKKNLEILENITIIRTLLKAGKLSAANNAELKGKVNTALKWFDNYVVKNI